MLHQGEAGDGDHIFLLYIFELNDFHLLVWLRTYFQGFQTRKRKKQKLKRSRRMFEGKANYTISSGQVR